MARRSPRTRARAAVQVTVVGAIDRAARAMARVLGEAFGELADVDGLAEAIGRRGVAVAGEVVNPEALGPPLRAGLLAGVREGVQAERRIALSAASRAVARVALEDVETMALRRPVPDRAAAWITSHGAGLVADIETGTRDAIRRVVSDGLARGEHPRTIAKRLRRVVGVHGRQVGPIQRAAATMREAGASAVRVDAMIERAMARAQRQRALMIARTETANAVQQGRAGLWDDLARGNHVERARVVRVWLTARDERVEDECAALDGEEVTGLDGPFPGGWSGPTIHPGCRCVVVFEERAA